MAHRCASPSGPPWGAWFFPCRGVMGAAALRRGSPSSGPHPLSVLPAPFSFSGILMGCLSFPSPLGLSLPLALFISAHHHPHPPQSLSSQSSFTACLTPCPALRQSLTPCLPSASAWPSRPAPGCLPRPQCPYPPCSDQSASQEWAPGVRDRKSRLGAGCGPCSMKESDLKPGRPGQAEAKNFSLNRRAGYLV